MVTGSTNFWTDKEEETLLMDTPVPLHSTLSVQSCKDPEMFRYPEETKTKLINCKV